MSSSRRGWLSVTHVCLGIPTFRPAYAILWLECYTLEFKTDG